MPTKVTYGKQREFANSLNLNSGERTRCTCPVCGGVNTFSAYNTGSTTIWHCFRASCNVSGATNRFDMSAQQIIEQLSFKSDGAISNWQVPSHFVEIFGNERCISMMRTYNSQAAYNNNMISMRFDPKLDRLVFLVKYKHHVCGAIGRSLTPQVLPKWYVYNNSLRHPLVVNKGSRLGIVVEDAFSACAIARMGVGGVSILGTSLQDSHIITLCEQFDNLVVALDKDASDKALVLHKNLSQYIPTKIMLIETDLKYKNDEDLAILIQRIA